MRKALIGLAVLLVVLVAAVVIADRPLRGAAEEALARRIQESESLPTRPEVRIEGRSFLLQAVRGRYREVRVAATEVPGGPVLLRSLDADLSGVRVPLGAALRGRVERVPVDQLRVAAVVPYSELERASGQRGLRVEPAGDRVRVSGQVRVLGREVTAVADSDVVLADGSVRLRAQRLSLGGASAPLTGTLQGAVDLVLAAPELPFGLRLDSLRVTPDGLRLQAGASDTVLSSTAR